MPENTDIRAKLIESLNNVIVLLFFKPWATKFGEIVRESTASVRSVVEQA
jgi:hypothetical protein